MPRGGGGAGIIDGEGKAMRALSRFGVSDMIATSAELRRLGDDATNFEDVATRVVRHLHETLTDDAGRPATALVRLYKTHAAELLDEPARRFAEAVLGEPVSPRTRCLTLFGTFGVEPSWCDRANSQGHKAIPLPSVEMVQRFPMIHEWMTQMGVDLPRLLGDQAADEALSTPLATEGTPYNVFLVPEAVGSRYIPAQDGFVGPYGVRSALGFGGDLATGDLFSVVMFFREPVAPETAGLFRALALAVKVAVMPFAAGPYFAAERTAVLVRDRSTFRLARAAVVEQLLAAQEQIAADEASRRAGDEENAAK